MASKRVLGAFARAAAPIATASSSRAASMGVARMSTAVAGADTSSKAIEAPGFLDFDPVVPLKAKHGCHVATLHLRSYETANLELYTQFTLQAARNLKIPTSNVARLPTTQELVTVPKSHFVHKKVQENWGRRTHRRAIKVYDAHRDTLDLLLRYLRRNGFAGVGTKAYIHEYVDYGFGAGELVEMEGMLAGPENEIEKTANDIVKALGGIEFEAPKPEAKEEAKEEVKQEVKAEAKEEAKEEVKAEAAEVKEEPAPASASTEAEPAASAEEPTEPKA